MDKRNDHYEHGEEPTVSVGDILPPASKKEDGKSLVNPTPDDESSDSDFNERMRDRDAEMHKNAAEATAEEETPSELDGNEASYERSRARGFDPLTHQRSTRKEVQQSKKANLEKDVEIDNFGRVKRGVKKSKFSFLNKLRLKNIAAHFKTGFRRSSGKTGKAAGKSSDASKEMSTYRHYTTHTPGNQAGIFDNTMEENKTRSAKDIIVGAAAARQFLGRGLDVIFKAQQAAGETVNKMVNPLADKLGGSAKEVQHVAKDLKGNIKAADMLDQPRKDGIGTLGHDAMRSTGGNQLGKDPQGGLGRQ